MKTRVVCHGLGLLIALSLLLNAVQAADSVVLRLKVRSGAAFSLNMIRPVPVNTPLLGAMEQALRIEKRAYPGLGPKITGVCGIAAGRGQFWALYVDGKLSPVGVEEVRVDHPMTVLWRLNSTSEYRPTP